MTVKSTILIATMITSSLCATFLATAPVEARDICFFMAFNGKLPQTSSFVVSGDGAARTMSTACKRAKRECERKLKRARKKREIPRGSRVPECLRIRGG